MKMFYNLNRLIGAENRMMVVRRDWVKKGGGIEKYRSVVTK